MLLGSLQRNPSVLFYYFDVLFLTHFWIYLQFILVYDVSDGFNFIFSLLTIQLFQHQLLKHSFFPLLIRAGFCYLSNFCISKFNPWALHSTSAAFVCTFNELFALGWHSSTKCYLLNANYRLGKQLSALQGWGSGEDLSLMPRTHFWKGRHSAYICNPSAGNTETGSFLGLTGQPAQVNWQLPGQWETVPKNIPSERTLRNDTWSWPLTPIHMCIYVCTHAKLLILF